MDLPRPLGDEEIARAAVGEPVRLDGRIELHEYDPAWADLYRREESRIRGALGDRVIAVEHVGSTSVPGLAAKPIIDIVLAVADSADEASYVPALEAERYTLIIREENWFEHRLFKGPDTDINLHVFSEGATEIDLMLAFRDHLRANPADRALYEHVKRDLASRDWKYVQNYADAKSEVITDITHRAQR